MRRIKRLQISNSFLSMMLDDGEKHYKVVKDMIPHDAIIVAAEMSFDGRSVNFLVQSNAFDSIEDGEVTPMLMPMLRDIR